MNEYLPNPFHLYCRAKIAEGVVSGKLLVLPRHKRSDFEERVWHLENRNMVSLIL